MHTDRKEFHKITVRQVFFHTQGKGWGSLQKKPRSAVAAALRQGWTRLKLSVTGRRALSLFGLKSFASHPLRASAAGLSTRYSSNARGRHVMPSTQGPSNSRGVGGGRRWMCVRRTISARNINYLQTGSPVFLSLRPTDTQQCWTRAKTSSRRGRVSMSLAGGRKTWRSIGCSPTTSTTLVRILGIWVCGR